jgi:hypothetical protein
MGGGAFAYPAFHPLAPARPRTNALPRLPTTARGSKSAALGAQVAAKRTCRPLAREGAAALVLEARLEVSTDSARGAEAPVRGMWCVVEGAAVSEVGGARAGKGGRKGERLVEGGIAGKRTASGKTLRQHVVC